MYLRKAFADGVGKVFMTLTGAIGQISIRVVLTWLLFGNLQLSAVALATGIGWIIANVFWGVIFLFDKKKVQQTNR